MSKRSEKSRKRRGRGPAQKARAGEVRIPSAATLFRFVLLDASVMALMEKGLATLRPALWARDGPMVRQIRRARTAEEVLDLVVLARGLGEPEWNKRMRRFGPEVVPLISERLRTVQEIRDEDEREMAVEKLVGALRWHGEAAARVLLERFDDLTEYGQSLACVMLGRLGATAGADRIWRFCQTVMQKQRDGHLVGALWGLIDLKDERAGVALVQLLEAKRSFYELYGFLSLAGDARAVLPLLYDAYRQSGERKADALMALVGVAHRIGREAVLAEFEKGFSPDEPREGVESLVDDLLARPVKEMEEYFALFYRGVTPDDMARITGRGPVGGR